jgi:hypothetical protein
LRHSYSNLDPCERDFMKVMWFFRYEYAVA